MLNLSKKLKIEQKLMLVIKISFGAFIGFIVGILSFIVLGSILSSFSIPKPTEFYRYSSQKSLIEFLIFFVVPFHRKHHNKNLHKPLSGLIDANTK